MYPSKILIFISNVNMNIVDYTGYWLGILHIKYVLIAKL